MISTINGSGTSVTFANGIKIVEKNGNLIINGTKIPKELFKKTSRSSNGIEVNGNNIYFNGNKIEIKRKGLFKKQIFVNGVDIAKSDDFLNQQKEEPKKYKLSESKEDILEYNGVTLHRIIALKDIVNEYGKVLVKTGQKGGYVENENNLSQEDSCWIFNNGKVYNNAIICDDAIVADEAEVSHKANISGQVTISNEAQVFGEAHLTGQVDVFEHAKIFEKAEISGKAKISGNVQIHGNADLSGMNNISGDVEIKDNADISGMNNISGNVIISGNADISGMNNISGNVIISKNADISGSNSISGDQEIYSYYSKQSTNNFSRSNIAIAHGAKVINKGVINKYGVSQEKGNSVSSNGDLIDLSANEKQDTEQ